MNTVVLWLLLSLPIANYKGGVAPASVVERFATKQECERVAKYAMDGSYNNSDYTSAPRVGCIQTTIAVVKQ